MPTSCKSFPRYVTARTNRAGSQYIAERSRSGTWILRLDGAGGMATLGCLDGYVDHGRLVDYVDGMDRPVRRPTTGAAVIRSMLTRLAARLMASSVRQGAR